ncbi:MAG TPA: Hpt domain-containing protein [Steroidobacteraceae bacterium]|nr:Hpt domain-containing protein [Steroidobacteraceae bacterium]
MTTPDELVATELARLSAKFVEQLPAQVRAVQDGVAGWLAVPCDAERYEIVSHRVHQLKGSGSTFGCPGISRAARTLERRIGACRSDIDAGRLPAIAAVESALQQLQNEATRVQTLSRDPEGGE